MDFTLRVYSLLIDALAGNGYEFIPVEQLHLNHGTKRVVTLRHDVDASPLNSLRTAIIEHRFGIRGTYYFRSVKESFDTGIIKKIAALGHEIGYHYEDLALAKGDYNKAFELFEKHLQWFEGLYNVTTICMHGSPLSKYDNRLLWEKRKYQSYGLICEPYFDIDFSKVLYLTDTGRMWNGEKVSVRDKELRNGNMYLSAKFNFRSTFDIIQAANNGELPDRVMLNFHPQRWTNDPVLWSKELIWQGIKNQIKGIIVKRNKKIQIGY